MIGAVRSLALVVLVVVGAGLWLVPSPAGAQESATVPLLDPAYRDLARLEELGLVGRGVAGQAPYSVRRMRWMAEHARRGLAVDSVLSPGARSEAGAILERLDRRVGADAEGPGLRGWLEAAAGGGRSPGRAEPFNGLGRMDVVVNPLWAYRGGRAYGDLGTEAVAGGLAVAPAPWIAFGAAARYSHGRYSGEVPGRTDLTVEALYVRSVLGRLALEVGRDQLWTPDAGGHDLVLSENRPPTDMLRLSTDRPLPVKVLGDVDLTLFAADLGPHQNFPHAKQFGVLVSARPTRDLTLRMSLLNKQLGDGAPDASVKDRLLDLTWVADWFRSQSYHFSDKLTEVGVDARLGPLAASAEAALTDFDATRLKHTFWAAAGYRVVLAAPALGPRGRHTVRAEAATLGPYMYRHHQFTSGNTVDRYLEGNVLGPDSRGASLVYAYDDATSGWSLEAGVSVDDRSGDLWTPSPVEHGGRPVRAEARPDETRLRGRITLRRDLWAGRGGVEISAGAERVDNWAYQDGERRTGRALLVRLWRGFLN